MQGKKCIIVTGGSRGIGKAIIEKFISSGEYFAITCGRKQEDLANLKQTHGELVETFQADFQDNQQVKDFAEFALSKTSQIDVLVHNAGLFLPGSLIEEPETNLPFLWQVNVNSAYTLNQILVPQMISAKNGLIAFIGSTASIMGYPNGGSYAITKHALLGMARTLRAELKSKNIKVSCLLPGATETDSWAGAGLPSERFMQASDIAEVVYCMSKLSAGAVIEEVLIRPQLGDI